MMMFSVSHGTFVLAKTDYLGQLISRDYMLPRVNNNKKNIFVWRHKVVTSEVLKVEIDAKHHIICFVRDNATSNVLVALFVSAPGIHYRLSRLSRVFLAAAIQ